jgi:hypothetical protein
MGVPSRTSAANAGPDQNFYGLQIILGKVRPFHVTSPRPSTGSDHCSGVVVLLLWLWLSSYAALLGAEVNAEMEQQTIKDSTTGEPEPLGQRDAVKADSIPDPDDPMKTADEQDQPAEGEEQETPKRGRLGFLQRSKES